MSGVILYTYPTSSCSFRVRITLNLKGIEYETRTIPSKERTTEEFAVLNPQRLVPMLVHSTLEGDHHISQSLGIIEYLEEVFPDKKRVLPVDPVGRARVRAISQYIVSEIQPMQNTRLDPYMESLGMDILSWKQHWIREGLRHLETMLAASPSKGAFCHGHSVTVADCCLIPQVYNAVERYSIGLEKYPTIAQIYKNCADRPEFQKAWPENQPDFEV